MKTTLLAAALASSLPGLSQARADDLYAWGKGKTPKEVVCIISPHSLGDAFKELTRVEAANNLPQPQVDYTTLAASGATIIHFTDPATGKPGYMVFYTNRAQCEADVAIANR